MFALQGSRTQWITSVSTPVLKAWVNSPIEAASKPTPTSAAIFISGCGLCACWCVVYVCECVCLWLGDYVVVQCSVGGSVCGVTLWCRCSSSSSCSSAYYDSPTLDFLWLPYSAKRCLKEVHSKQLGSVVCACGWVRCKVPVSIYARVRTTSTFVRVRVRLLHVIFKIMYMPKLS